MALLRWWRAPLWLLALGTGAKSFADNPLIGSERLNRRGLHARRVKLAHRLARSRRRRLAAAVPADWRERFDRDGFVAVPDFLPAGQFAALRDSLLTASLPAREQQQGDTLTRRVPIGPALRRRFPALDELLDDPRWRGLLAYVASTTSEPFYYVQTVSAGAAQGEPDPQIELHSDTFHPSMKAWLFLTDVAEESAPLTYVAGSHRADGRRLAWEQARSLGIRNADRLSQRGSLRVGESELSALGLPRPTRFAVPANTLVVIDTYGFHARGPSPQPSVRVEIWAFARRSPFLPWTGLDLFSKGPFRRRRAPLLMGLLDRLDRLGLARQHWRESGDKRPLDP
ncbi:phytanoyl-CoA dioxygenase family protein [Sphingomonas sabuli]|uniref:Phytanoyl-CoA dioxygenase family protein n=1 Tax=Sphingomonas sabuli TaxID=2764186 RepID=A0A7G9L2C0_9SPHN|nr:phytanoyl-CoA dioxygenase family protein [Sphingomonas sabuli]QNM82769.1 phytanoyl-CoA dioxygenase family protein [Sphingomonas sabuli]